MHGRMMRKAALAFIILSSISSAAVADSLEGEWHCTYEEPGYKTTRILQFVGDKLIHTDGFGRSAIVESVIITEDYVFWDNKKIQEFEFYPKKGKLIENTNLTDAKLVYNCVK